MKRKLLALILTLLVISLCACSKTEDDASSETETLTPVEQFAEDNEVSVSFATSLDNAVQQVTDKYGQKFDIEDVYNFEETNEWANGKRYTIWLGQQYVLTVYEENDEVTSIRTSNGDFAYSKD